MDGFSRCEAAVKDQVDIHTDFATICAPFPLHCVAQAVKFLITNPRLLNVADLCLLFVSDNSSFKFCFKAMQGKWEMLLQVSVS